MNSVCLFPAVFFGWLDSWPQPRAQAIGLLVGLGLLALLLLALTAALAGVHFNWRMAIVGLILAATFVAVVMLEDYFWVPLIIAFVAVIVIIQTRRRTA